MKMKILGVSAFLLLSLFWACHTVDSQDSFDIQGDSTWTKCDSVLILLKDGSGKILDTLYNDSLKSLDQLKRLAADKYKGGDATVYIRGTKAGGPCFEQSRSFNDSNGKVTVTVDTAFQPGVKPVSISLKPDMLALTPGSSPALLTATLKPAYASQLFLWSVEGADAANVEFPGGSFAGQATLKALKTGTVKIRVRAKQDTNLVDSLIVMIASTTTNGHVKLVPDSMDIFVGGSMDSLTASVLPDSASQKVSWSSDDPKIATVDSSGRVKGIASGTTHIRALSKAFDVSSAAKVNVILDVPVLTIAGRPGAAVNKPIVYTPSVTQQFGSIVMFKWDLNGDSTWDDSLPGPWNGTKVALPSITAKFNTVGVHHLYFYVRDSEGNEAIAEIDAGIGNQPPDILSITPDTTIVAGDSLEFSAKAVDPDGKVAGYAWDYLGEGTFSDTVLVNDSIAAIKGKFKYAKVGKFNAILKVVDDNDKPSIDTVKVNVILDLPIADAGNDTTVIAGSLIHVHAKGTDAHSAIAKREIKLGSGSFTALSKQDTTLRAPSDSGTLVIVVRVTNGYDNSALDTMVVNVRAPSKANADLSGLAASAGTLTPVFKPVTLFYSLSVGYSDSLVSVVATPSDTAASLAINGKPVKADVASDPVSVPVGTTVNVFQIVVTAQDGTQKVYSASVTRAPSSDASLSKLETEGITLKPSFAPKVFTYADTVENPVTSIRLKPTVKQGNAKVTVGDSATASGSFSPPESLIVGDNLINVVVTAQDGKSKSTYAVAVVRKARLILARRTPAGALVRLDSADYAIGQSVPISAPSVVGSHFTNWTLLDGKATISDSLADTTVLLVKSPFVRAAAIFAINTYSVKTSTDGRGVLTAKDSVAYGDQDTATVAPLAGYRLLSFTDNGTDKLASISGGKYIFTVKETHSLAATFLRTYSLTATDTGTGSVTPPPATVDSNSNYTFTFTTSGTGNNLNTLTDNGTNVTASLTGPPMAVSNYALTGISEDHVIKATFGIKTFHLTVVGHGVSVCPTGQSCLILCIPGKGCLVPPDSVTVTVNYGVSYNISTSNTASSTDTSSFKSWVGGPPTASGNPAAVTLTAGDAKYRADYCGAKCFVICCVIITPVTSTPVTISPTTSVTPPISSETAAPSAVP